MHVTKLWLMFNKRVLEFLIWKWKAKVSFVSLFNLMLHDNSYIYNARRNRNNRNILCNVGIQPFLLFLLCCTRVGRCWPQKNKHGHTGGIKLGIIKTEYLISQDKIDENNQSGFIIKIQLFEIFGLWVNGYVLYICYN